MHRPSCMGRLGQRSEHAPCADDGTTGRVSRFPKSVTMHLIKKRALFEGARYARPVRVWCHLRAPLPGTTTTHTPSRPWGRIRKRRSWDSNVQAERCCPPPGRAGFGFVADRCAFRMTDGIPMLASPTRTQGSHPDGASTDPAPACTVDETRPDTNLRCLTHYFFRFFEVKKSLRRNIKGEKSEK